MIDDTAFLILVGAMLLLGGLVAVAKVGMWVWLVSRVTHRPVPERETSSPLDGVKKLLAVISTALGIVATSVGLARECGWMPRHEEPVRERVIEVPSRGAEFPGDPRWSEDVVEPVVPTASMTCCTSVGSCVMMDGAYPVGSPCYCASYMGPVAGVVCGG